MARKIYRKKRPSLDADLDLLPIMNLFMVLIPFLLLSAVFVKISVIDIYLPQASATPTAKGDKKPPQILTIHVTEKGFSFSELGKSLPKINKRSGKYNFSALTKSLLGLKQKYPESGEVVLLFVSDTPYETVVKTMDSSRETIVNKETITLYPNVSIGTHLETGK